MIYIAVENRRLKNENEEYYDGEVIEDYNIDEEDDGILEEEETTEGETSEEETNEEEVTGENVDTENDVNV